MRRLALLAAALLAATVLTSCEGASDGSAADATADAAAPKFNQADADFIPAMNQLLSQSTTMAEMAAQRASSPEVKQLAAQMKAGQYVQLDKLVVYLKEMSKQPDLDVTHDHGASAHTIPGFLDQEQLDRMATMKGARFDREFVRLMMAHHDGGLRLARTQRAQGQYQPAKDLAAQLEDNLNDEMGRMKALQS